MNNNKFFTIETEQRNRFYQVPKQFMDINSKYFSLKPLTKLIYGILSDRNSLSVKNGWYDQEGRIYFNFNQKELGEILGIKDTKTIRKHLKELEDFELLYRERVGLKKADRLYLLQLDFEDLNGTYENRAKSNSVESKENGLMGKNSLSRRGKIPYQEGEKFPTNDTNINKTNLNDTEITTTKETNTKEVAVDLDSSSEINLNIKNITKTNIKKLKLNQEQIELLEQYVLKNEYDNIDKFSYYIAKCIKQEKITVKDLAKSLSNKKELETSNQKIENFREKNYDYNALERELLGWDD